MAMFANRRRAPSPFELWPDPVVIPAAMTGLSAPAVAPSHAVAVRGLDPALPDPMQMGPDENAPAQRPAAPETSFADGEDPDLAMIAAQGDRGNGSPNMRLAAAFDPDPGQGRRAVPPGPVQTIARSGRPDVASIANLPEVSPKAALRQRSIDQKVIAAAQNTERTLGTPASVQIAQFGVESRWGKDVPPGSYNPFGIKALPGEPYVEAWTKEPDARGRLVPKREKFRIFKNYDEAFEHHGRLLAQGKYAAAYRAKLPDIGAAVEELGHGTAKSPRYNPTAGYGAKLRDIMRARGLGDFDGTSGQVFIPPYRRAAAKK